MFYTNGFSLARCFHTFYSNEPFGVFTLLVELHAVTQGFVPFQMSRNVISVRVLYVPQTLLVQHLHRKLADCLLNILLLKQKKQPIWILMVERESNQCDSVVRTSVFGWRTIAWFSALHIRCRKRCRSRFHKNRVRTGRLCRCCWGQCVVIHTGPRARARSFPRKEWSELQARMNGIYGKIELDPIWTATANLRKQRTLFFFT